MEWGMVTRVSGKLVWSALGLTRFNLSVDCKFVIIRRILSVSGEPWPPLWNFLQIGDGVNFESASAGTFQGSFGLKQCCCDLVQLVQRTLVKLAILYLAPCNWVLLMLDWCSAEWFYKPRVPDCSQKWHWENGRNMVERHKSWFTTVFDVSLWRERGRLGSTLIICH